MLNSGQLKEKERRLTGEYTPSMTNHMKAAKRGGHVAKVALTVLESKLGRSDISSAQANDYLQGKKPPKRFEGERGGKEVL